MINFQIGAAFIDYWSLTPIEFAALAKASRGELTENEQAAKEAENQRRIAASLGMHIPPPPAK